MAFNASSLNLSLTLAVANAISFLTRPLAITHAATTVIRLQLILETSLTSLFAASWVPQEPLRGSGRRCLTLSPHCLPPRVIHTACVAAGIEWSDWIATLGGQEFDLFVDPGRVSVRLGKKNSGAPLMTIWEDDSLVTAAPAPQPTEPSKQLSEARIQARLQIQVAARAREQREQRKTMAQQLLEATSAADEDEIFAMIADEFAAPTWKTPVGECFPTTTMEPFQPLFAIPEIYEPIDRPDSRSSSHSSASSFTSTSSVPSLSSSISTLSSRTTTAAYIKAEPKPDADAALAKPAPTMSRRERARMARVFIDKSKTDVTHYDGGKTNVLTGGVMLGGGSKAPSPASHQTKRPSTVGTWRARV